MPRITDAISPLTGGADVASLLENKTITLQAPNDLESHPVHLAGFELLTNLCARLYPNLRILAPKAVAQHCKSLALQINPTCAVETEPGPSDAGIAWNCSPGSVKDVSVAPAGWLVIVDEVTNATIEPSNILVSLTAACIAVGELFRTVFAEVISQGRVSLTPARLNVLTLDDSADDLPPLPSEINIGRAHLIGAGAVGQAAIYTLARLPVTGTVVVVDPEVVALSNLQRYVLTEDLDVGTSKCALVAKALRGSKLETACFDEKWGAEGLSRYGDLEVACVAVDSAATRIEIQAGLPKTLLNAWTQPADLGWSRHENFGNVPCLACLYWPSGPRRSQHELIASAIRQSELRVLAYLTHRLPVDQVLDAGQIPKLSNMPVPAESKSWVTRSLLDDVVVSLGIAEDDRTNWNGKKLPDLYREGICGGALVRSSASELPQDVAVPLAHQSVLAGVMLAAQLIFANSPQLRGHLPTETEARLDVLKALPQILPRPRQRTAGCICADADFIETYRSKWSS